jgi:tetratricopeptide (TPR) repeat protein
VPRLRHMLMVALMTGVALDAAAEPYKPTQDTEVLERLPHTAARGDTTMRTLREWHARDPSNPDIALRLAQAQIAAARAANDPRLWGQAQATLTAWWELESPPVAMRLARAAIRQNRHEFAAAREDLLRAVAQEPQHAQAWLDLASLQQATGDLNAAAQSCTHVSNAIGVICSAGVAALTGRAEAAFTAIETVFVQRRIADQPVSVRIWAATLLAEIAERLGRHDDAEHWYRHSLSIDPTDAYTLAAYADFLLDRGRPAEVTKLIAADTTIDNLLLRRVQADHALDVESAQAGIAELAARFDALRERGDRVHRREESRFRLALAADADTALTLALDNWTVQKEPLDARIVLEAALATHRPQAARDVANAIVASGLQDGRLTALLAATHTP